MKKKLKVQKAFRGKIIRSAVKQPSKPLINLFKPQQPRPGVPQRDPNMFSTTPPRPTYGTRPDGTRQLIHPAAGGIRPGVQPLPPMQPSSQIDPSSPRSLPFASAVGPSMQGVGDPRLGAATIPGNQAQMQMRGPTQAAPVQPVPAMKKGGMVRGQGAAIRGTKFKGIF